MNTLVKYAIIGASVIGAGIIGAKAEKYNASKRPYAIVENEQGVVMFKDNQRNWETPASDVETTYEKLGSAKTAYVAFKKSVADGLRPLEEILGSR